MPSSVEHQVSIVPVFNLQQEADDGVSSHTFDEVGSSLKTAKSAVMRTSHRGKDYSEGEVAVEWLIL